MRGPRDCVSGVPLPLGLSCTSVGEAVSPGTGESGNCKALFGSAKTGGRFPRHPSAGADVFTKDLMTKHGDGRLAGGQEVLREQVGDGAIRRALLP